MPIRIENGTEVVKDIGFHALLAVCLFVLMKVIHIAIARRDERKRIFGEPICWWAAGVYLLGGFVGLIIEEYEPRTGKLGGASEMLGAVGLWVGVCIGLFHGGRQIDKKFPLMRLPDPFDGNRESES
ncbi:MAG: hypothetical protein ACK5YR_05185 [Pirellula sp.]|jgi:hypothetical protein